MGESDKNVKIDITATASGMEPGVTDATAKLDKLSRSTSKMASEYSGLDAATKKMTGSTAAYTADVNKLDGQLTALLQSINPAYAAMMKLDQGTDLLNQGLAHGLISNQQYASSVSLLESKFASATIETGKAVTMTARARAEMVVLGREVAQGNLSRVPGTLSIIAQGLSPVALGIGAVTVALAAGGYAWYKWGEDGTLASSKVLNNMEDVLKAAQEGAKQSKHMNQVEQLAEIDKEIIALEQKHNKTLEELEGKSLVKRMGSHYAMRDKEISLLKDTAAAQAQHLENLKRNAQEILDTLNQKATGEGEKRRTAAQKEKDSFIASMQRESDTYGMTAGQIKIYEAVKKGMVGTEIATVVALANEIDAHNAAEKAAQQHAQVAIKAAQDHAKAVEQANAILFGVDPIAKANHEWQTLLDLKQRAGDEFPMTVEQMGAAYAKAMAGMEKASEKTATAMSETWKTFADNTQRTLSDVLYNGMNGQFNNIEEMFKQMLFRMAANAASMRLTEGLFGTGKGGDLGLIGKLFSGSSTTGLAGMDQSMPIMAPSFAGGGYTGDGARTGGIDGKGGFQAILHPNEKVLDLTKGQSGGGGQLVINDNSVINVGDRSDRAQVLADVSGLIDQKQAQLVDRLRREGAIA